MVQPIFRIVILRVEDIQLITVDNLKISFNGFVAVNQISFTVQPGQVIGILGSNGAGKSSTMKALAGIIRPESGEIIIDNHLLTSLKEEEEAKKVIGYCPDVGGVVTGATPREHIQLLLKMHKREHDYPLGLYLIHEIGLDKFIDTPVGSFSHGMSRRLSVVLATLASSKVLILDEPFDGVDPIGVDAIEKIIKEAKNNGLAVVVCTHLQSILTRVVDNLLIMKDGEIIDALPAGELSGERGEQKYKEILEKSGATDKASFSTTHVDVEADQG